MSGTFDVVVIGGGQAGIAVGHHLQDAGLNFVVVDENARVGDAWRHRWDSLRLFTPAVVDAMPGERYPAPPWSFPSHTKYADYLEDYVARTRIPVRLGTRVRRLARSGRVSRSRWTTTCCWPGPWWSPPGSTASPASRPSRPTWTTPSCN